MHNETLTLREALTAASAQLASREDLRANASKDAELLLLHTLSAPRTLLFTDPGRSLSLEQQLTFNTLISRRLAGEPIQYITGEQDFYGLPFRVTPAVLIPRPETELLVEAVVSRLEKDGQIVIADVGTGSGALAIALAHSLPKANVVAIDLSGPALEVAARNAVALGVAGRIRFLEGDLLTSLSEKDHFDAIVSNPPYVPLADRGLLHPQVRDHEPALALFAGDQGMDVFERLIPQASAALKPGGLLALEIGFGQQESVLNLLSHWTGAESLPDLHQIPRVILARKKTQ